MSDTAPKRPAAIYTRVSKRKGCSVEEQETGNRAECERNGWPVAEIYTDSISASRFARKGRPDWARLLADLDLGSFGVLVLWESSRGDRDPESWMGLLRRCRERGVLVHVTSHARTYDMANPRDWRTLAEDGVDSAYESEKTSLRLQRAMAGNALSGRPHGMVVYGYQRVYDEHTRKLAEQRPHPEQAPVVAEIVRRVAAAVPISAITHDLTARGVPTARGGTWDRATVRKIAVNPAYIGKRPWKGQLYDAMWPPIVDEAAYWSAVRLLADPARKTTRPGRQVHLLSFLAVCGECGAWLAMFQAASRRPHPMYGCSRKGCVYVRADSLDAYATAVMCAYLARPDVIEELRASSGGDDGKLTALRGELAAQRGELAELRGAAHAGRMSVASAIAIEPGILTRIGDLERKERELATPPALAGLITPGEDVAARWEEAPMSSRRQVARLLCSPAILGTLRLGRALGTGHRATLEQRVRWDRETGAAAPVGF